MGSWQNARIRYLYDMFTQYVISDNCMTGYKRMLRIQAFDANEWNKNYSLQYLK